MTKKRPEVVRVRPVDDETVVKSLEGPGGGYRKEPCEECPWRVERAGNFPAEAFRHSAETAYDAAVEKFACHMSGLLGTTCAGFILATEHNLGLRISEATGRIDRSKVQNGGAELFESYREMAIANGVDPDDPALARCRP